MISISFRKTFCISIGVKLMFREKNDAYQLDAIGMEYLDGLYSYALVLSRNQADAEDLVQETYVRAARTLSGLQADSNLKRCFFTILRNMWLDRLRKGRSGPHIVETNLDESPANGSSYDLQVSKIEGERVRAAIDMLPVAFREIIVLRECEQLSYEEIGSIVGCAAGTVVSRLGKARSELRILLSAKLMKSGSCQWEQPSEGMRWG
jgi:RNA polymerase sigma-70 factor, ECF subfamily